MNDSKQAGKMDEPPGLWAVVEWIDPSHPDWPQHLVKGPGAYSGWYWYPLGSENGWGWDQVASWPGTLRLVRSGVREEPPHTFEELNPGQWICKDCGYEESPTEPDRRVTHGQVTEALLAAWMAQSEVKVAATPREHCETLAASVMELLRANAIGT